MANTVIGTITEQEARFVVRPCVDVPHMHYVVWDTARNRPVAYSAGWVDAYEAGARWQAHPPFDPSRLVERAPDAAQRADDQRDADEGHR